MSDLRKTHGPYKVGDHSSYTKGVKVSENMVGAFEHPTEFVKFIQVANKSMEELDIPIRFKWTEGVSPEKEYYLTVWLLDEEKKDE